MVFLMGMDMVAVSIGLLAWRQAHEPSHTDNRRPSTLLRRDHRAPVAGLSALLAVSIRARLFAWGGRSRYRLFQRREGTTGEGTHAQEPRADMPGALGVWENRGSLLIHPGRSILDNRHARRSHHP
jgi:hypothetical protein